MLKKFFCGLVIGVTIGVVSIRIFQYYQLGAEQKEFVTQCVAEDINEGYCECFYKQFKTVYHGNHKMIMQGFFEEGYFSEKMYEPMYACADSYRI